MSWNVRDLVSKAGNLIVSHLLLVHAWSGCDTTSATFGHGKTTLLKKLKASEVIQEISSVLCNPNASQEEIGQAGLQLFVILYGGKQQDSLNGLRYAKFMEMVSSSKTSIDPQKLPPTERTAYFHCLRVYLHVIIWSNLSGSEFTLDPKQWGWKVYRSVYMPITTDMNAAPESLLKFVRCRCKLSAKNPCGSNLCSCRRHGLKCVTACGDCRGETCRNSEPIEPIIDGEETEV